MLLFCQAHSAESVISVMLYLFVVLIRNRHKDIALFASTTREGPCVAGGQAKEVCTL